MTKEISENIRGGKYYEPSNFAFLRNFWIFNKAVENDSADEFFPSCSFHVCDVSESILIILLPFLLSDYHKLHYFMQYK